MNAATVAAIASALSCDTRVRVLALADGQHPVGAIAAELGVTTADVSFHLRRLAAVGLVERLRHGRWTFPRRLDHGWRVLARELA